MRSYSVYLGKDSCHSNIILREKEKTVLGSVICEGVALYIHTAIVWLQNLWYVSMLGKGSCHIFCGTCPTALPVTPHCLKRNSCSYSHTWLIQSESIIPHYHPDMAVPLQQLFSASHVTLPQVSHICMLTFDLNKTCIHVPSSDCRSCCRGAARFKSIIAPPRRWVMLISAAAAWVWLDWSWANE